MFRCKLFFDGRVVTKLAMPFYAVRTGKNPGIYETWKQCEEQVKGFTGARYKKFSTETEAQAFIAQDQAPSVPDTSHVDSASRGSPDDAPPLMTPIPSFVNGGVPPTNRASSNGGSPQNKTTLLALKGMIRKMDACAEQMRSYVTQAEEYVNQLEQSSVKLSRSASEPSSSSVGLAEPPMKRRKKTLGYLLHSAKISTTDAWIHTTLNDEQVLSVYTDGCCHANGRGKARAGIGVYWGRNNTRNVGEPLPGRQTNNRAEICAATRAVEQAKEMNIEDLVVYTDSMFLINCITKWIKKWKRNKWRLQGGGEVINREELEELDSVLTGIRVYWRHVVAHQGIVGNEEADRLANEGARSMGSH